MKLPNIMISGCWKFTRALHNSSENIERFSEVDPKNQSENNYNNSHSKIGSIMKKVIYMYCKRQAQTFF